MARPIEGQLRYDDYDYYLYYHCTLDPIVLGTLPFVCFFVKMDAPTIYDFQQLAQASNNEDMFNMIVR